MITITSEKLPVHLLFDHSPDPKIQFAWLGQAGFIIRYRGTRIMIDPYLSDSLADKYKNSKFPHTRMMPSPIHPKDVRPLDYVLCSHRHSDLMDPGTLPVLAKNNPDCRFIVPRAEIRIARERGIPDGQLIDANVGDNISLRSESIHLEIVASAHESIETDENGDHRYLGFVINFGDLIIYHSGDGVPYEGLAELLAQHGPDIAFLPVNGRDEFRRRNGFPGNFTFDESIELCLSAGIPIIVAHHFGMFDFNTISQQDIDKKLKNIPGKVQCIIPKSEYLYSIQTN
jgi:L-ascorbate metabolism protein UlaG (beta-lactamase superfamily)